MNSSLKILGQIAPAASTLTTLYSCSATNGVSVSSISICNTTASEITIRVSVANANEADSLKQYLYYDLNIQAKDTFMATIGLSLSKNDVVRVWASTTSVAFQIFGVEIS